MYTYILTNVCTVTHTCMLMSAHCSPHSGLKPKVPSRAPATTRRASIQTISSHNPISVNSKKLEYGFRTIMLVFLLLFCRTNFLLHGWNITWTRSGVDSFPLLVVCTTGSLHDPSPGRWTRCRKSLPNIPVEPSAPSLELHTRLHGICPTLAFHTLWWSAFLLSPFLPSLFDCSLPSSLSS